MNNFANLQLPSSAELSTTAEAYVRSINDHDPVAFNALFASGAVVNDVGREFRGTHAIKKWSDREIFDAHVTLEVLGAAERDGETVITSKVEGSFDRTGLPDPLILEHHLAINGDKIVRLTCGLAGSTLQA
jgi:hypothetical protein